MRLGLTILALWASPSLADEVTVCYNYSCAVQAKVVFPEQRMHQLESHFQHLATPSAERTAIAWVIGRLEALAGEQSPTYRDRGGNLNDDGLDGRMDCIDHSHNTTAYLRLMESRGWLKFHRVLEPVKRAPFMVIEHWSAHIVEIDTQQEFAVDSWFFDNGQPAAIYNLEDWMRGASPDV